MSTVQEPQQIVIRSACADDADAIWPILEEVVRLGETYALPAEMSKEDALAFWLSPGHTVFVAEQDGRVAGTYFLRPNQKGGGSHVANCGYMTASWAAGRGIARAMCAHSLDCARNQGFLAMQFNFVVSTNTRAVELWQRMGFAIVGRIPAAFRHPVHGLVEVFVMHRLL